MFEGGLQLVDTNDALRLAEALRCFIGETDLARLSVVATEAVRRLLGCRGASFVLAEGSQVYYAEESSPERLWKGRRFPASACISGWAVENGRSAAIPDIRVDSRIPQEAYRPTFVKSLIMAPMRLPGRRPVGALGAYWAEPRQPTESEVFLIEALADAVAAAVEHVRHLEAERPRPDSSGPGADGDLGRLLPVIAHDLRSPLAAVRTGLDILQVDPSGEHVPRVLERMKRSLGRADRLIRHLVRYAQVAQTGAIPLHLAPTRLDEICDGIREEVESIHPGRRILFEVPAIEGMWDADRLSEAIANLLLNAAEHGAADSVVRLDARVCGETLELRVHNFGAPIPEEALPDLFAPFSRFGPETSRGSVGLGLFIADQVARAHGGHIEATSSPESGTALTIFLPLAPPAFLAQGDAPHDVRAGI